MKPLPRARSFPRPPAARSLRLVMLFTGCLLVCPVGDGGTAAAAPRDASVTLVGPSRVAACLSGAVAGSWTAPEPIFLPIGLHGSLPPSGEAGPTKAPSAGRPPETATEVPLPSPTDLPTVAPLPTATQVAAATPQQASPTAEACRPSQLGGPVDLSHLSMGNDRILRRDRGERQPQAGALWLCGVPPDGRGNSNAADWSNPDGSWDFNRKPTVDGAVSFSSVFQVALDGQGRRLITGNALPSFLTGIFPIDPSSLAYRYDRNPSHVEAHEVRLDFPANPEPLTSPRCVTFGATGISLTGNAIYHGASTLGNDASAHEMLDAFGGQSDGTMTYHTHFLTEGLLDALDTCEPGHSALMGYIMDGFGIYGPRGEDGKILTSADLDPCHGHTHPVLWDGKMVNMYHYHWTYDFPYNVGCFKGAPVKPWN